MDRTIKTLLFGSEQECQAAAEVLAALDHLTGLPHDHRSVDDLEELEILMADWTPTLLIVLANGARGMEGVYRARDRRPGLPVFWFSDDRDFGMQSYRLGCAYFATKPLTPDKIHHAIRRCDHVGIRYAGL